MAKVNKIRRRSGSQHHRTSVSSCCSKVSDDVTHRKRTSRTSQKKDWEDASCSVCMEHPHNAVLLLCSSYDKGCRPYMCATSSRYSNCLEQYKKAYMKVTGTQCAQPWHGATDDPHLSSAVGCLDGKTEMSELLCPLCRGQVKGWTVVEAARKYLNSKKRTCMQDKCSFVGTYRELRKHVRAEHPLGHPREVDPSLVEKWKKLENERELNDVFSTIRSTMPGAIVMGDYVIEGPPHAFSRNYEVDDYFEDALFHLESFGGRWNDDSPSTGIFDEDYHSLDEDDFLVERARAGALAASRRLDNYISQMTRYRRGRVVLERSRQRRRHRVSSRDR